MGDKRNYAALEWVIGEIGETLNDARQALEAFVEDPRDSARIRFCLTHIHQVHGSLQMVEFHGASLFAEEMEALAQAMIHGAVVNEKEAQEVLMRSLLQLPHYLEQAKAYHDDHPGIVLPLLNDIRAVRKQSYLSETNLFNPNLSSLDRIKGSRHSIFEDANKLSEVVKKLREMYQYAATSVLRGIKVDENLRYIDKVFVRLEGIARGTAHYPLWQVSSALSEALSRDDIELSVAVRGLFRQLARELKVLEENCPQAFDAPPKQSLLRNLLFYVARAEDGGVRVAQVKSDFGLETALLGGGAGLSKTGMVSAPDSGAVRAVIEALGEELSSIKHLMNLVLSGHGGLSDLEEMLPIVKRIGDTLAVLGIGDMRKLAMDQLEILEQMAQSGSVVDSQLVDVAERIADLEHRLEAIAKGVGTRSDYTNVNEREVQIDAAKEAVIKECRTGLDRVKDVIVQSMSSQWDPSCLPSAVEIIRDIQGGLNIVPLARPADIMARCGRYIDEKMTQATTTPVEELQVLANAIASIDYFLERLGGRHGEVLEEYLDIAEDSLTQLGYGVNGPADSAVSGDGAEADKGVEAVEPVEAHEPVEAYEPAETHSGSPAAAAFSLGDDQPEGELTIASLPKASVAEPSEQRPDDIDEEIVEIFIEEANEVQETLAEYAPKWQDSLDDNEALTTVRRCFHTLKGSGRMVGAEDVGALSWSVEEMLNRVVDASVPVHKAHARLVSQALGFLPSLVEAFKTRQANPDVALWSGLIAKANALAAGDIPSDLDGIDANVPSAALGDGENSEQEDLQLWEIFSSETNTHLDVVEQYIESMELAAPLYAPPTDQLQSALHTLKGSAHMAGVKPIAAVISPLEGLCKELRNYQINANKDVLQLLKDAASYTREGLVCIDNNQPVTLDKQDEFVQRVGEISQAMLAPSANLTGESEASERFRADPKLLTLFMSEQMSLLLEVDRRIDDVWRDQHDVVVVEAAGMLHELEALSEASSQANLPEMQTLSERLLGVYEAIRGHQLTLSEPVFDVLKAAHESLLNMVDQVAAGQSIVPISDELSQDLTELLAQPEPADAFGFVSEGDDNFAEELFGGAFSEEEIIQAGGEVVQSESVESIAELEQEPEPESDLERESEPEPEPELEPEMQSGMDSEFESIPDLELETEQELEAAFDSLADEQLQPEADLEPELEPLSDLESEAAPNLDSEPELESEPDLASISDLELEPLRGPQVPPTVTQAQPSGPSASLFGGADYADDDISKIDDDDFDPDILDIFLEEAVELIEELDESIHSWSSDWQDTSASEVMKRALHTMKGGARLSGVTRLGDLTHDYESYLIASTEPSEQFFADILEYQDSLVNTVKSIRQRSHGGAAEPVEAPDIAAPSGAEGAQFEPTELSPDNKGSGADVVPFSMPQAAPELDDDAGANQAMQQGSARRAGPQEMVKVPSDLLEELVNLAGETSISRGRLEQQVSDMGAAVEEVDSTLGRLNEQLRRLDMETEAQAMFRREQMAQDDQFDPLEMDRYSQLQQLTRSLMESSSDLVDLRHTISNKLRDTETMLLQQQRINSSLQEGLMRSRMVPFSRLVPRLRRIVRQVSGELGKHVNFELDNVEGEMDRSVLERMVAPLEHMLRNAVDHGIESPDERQGASKPETGRILLSLAREGGDILLRLADDGRGINLERVREKAIERGLMTEDSELSDHDVMQFILQAGFSTAENVTQISGRGVGLDVVAAEIKQLGGSMMIESKASVGTQFVVRLPFTVSVNRALMVRLDKESYAIPLNTIEGIVRVSPFELEHYYTQKDARFEYAGENYQVKYLGGMITMGAKINLEGQLLPLPVILVRSGQLTMALQVDGLSGSREIVVKSLGPQFAAVQGISGATVMGDGSVVVILDPHALVRKEMAQTGASLASMPTAQAAPAAQAPSHKTIMVVDDSVTVRKVTTRFLEREGFNVIIAKDGLDALQVLEETTPDLMLLDIEMPRMDGFEVAKTMRSTQRWKHTPIIMITSRTGDKHRQHAMSIGVNDYMGKPYQEEGLLRSIQALLDKQIKSA